MLAQDFRFVADVPWRGIRAGFIDGQHLAVIGVDCLTVDLVCDRCGRQQCPGCGSAVIVDLDAGTTLCSNCRLVDGSS